MSTGRNEAYEWLPSMCCVSPRESFVCPSKMTSSHMGPLQRAQPRGVDPSGTTWACHMFGMNHLILSCELSEEEKSIKASRIFSEQTRGLWKPFRSSSPWTASSVFLNGQLQRLQPSLHLAPSRACPLSQNWIPLRTEQRGVGLGQQEGGSLCVLFPLRPNNCGYERDSISSKPTSPAWTTFFLESHQRIVTCPLVFSKLYLTFSAQEIKCPLSKKLFQW